MQGSKPKDLKPRVPVTCTVQLSLYTGMMRSIPLSNDSLRSRGGLAGSGRMLVSRMHVWAYMCSAKIRFSSFNAASAQLAVHRESAVPVRTVRTVHWAALFP